MGVFCMPWAGPLWHRRAGLATPCKYFNTMKLLTNESQVWTFLDQWEWTRLVPNMGYLTSQYLCRPNGFLAVAAAQASSCFSSPRSHLLFYWLNHLILKLDHLHIGHQCPVFPVEDVESLRNVPQLGNRLLSPHGQLRLHAVSLLNPEVGNLTGLLSVSDRRWRE